MVLRVVLRPGAESLLHICVSDFIKPPSFPSEIIYYRNHVINTNECNPLDMKMWNRIYNNFSTVLLKFTDFFFATCGNVVIMWK